MKIENWSIVIAKNDWSIEIKMIKSWNIEIVESFFHSLFEFENKIFMKKDIVKNVIIVDVDVDVDHKKWKLRQAFKKKKRCNEISRNDF